MKNGIWVKVIVIGTILVLIGVSAFLYLFLFRLAPTNGALPPLPDIDLEAYEKILPSSTP
ncbi:MAG: hypothetical protein Q8P95_01830 [bacterium]|nr:hypothetical protein [bacterium]